VSSFIGSVKAFAGDEDGATAIEYALIATAIFLAIVPPMTVIASRMGTTYQSILNYFDAV
jgi:Flp pilus assembly pilin Flp